MTLKNHMITNTCTLVSLPLVCYHISNIFSKFIFEDYYIIESFMNNSFFQSFLLTDNLKLNSIMYLYSPIGVFNYFPILLIFYYIGTIFPCIDSYDKIVNFIRKKIISFNIKTCEFFHNIWFIFVLTIILVCCNNIMIKLSIWFFNMGYFFHLFYDNLSVYGLCWTYPFSKYKIYSNNKRVKKRHKLRFYNTGTKSETKFVFNIVLFTIFLFVISYINGFPIILFDVLD